MEWVLALLAIGFYFEWRRLKDSQAMTYLMLKTLTISLTRRGVINQDDLDRSLNMIAGETYEGDWKKVQKSGKRIGVKIESYMDDEEFEEFIKNRKDRRGGLHETL